MDTHIQMEMLPKVCLCHLTLGEFYVVVSVLLCFVNKFVINFECTHGHIDIHILLTDSITIFALMFYVS